jgi:hypothetical protein
MKKYPRIDHWTDVRLELYCTINWDYGTKCGKYVYVMDDEHDFEHMKKEPNPNYDKHAKFDKWPKKCTQKLGIHCIQCKHVCYCKYDEDLEEEEGLK